MENQTDVSGDKETALGSLRIFLNYRRTDTEDAAGRLFDALSERFGEARVFMDIDTIQPGVDFDEVVHQAVGQCDVLLALIGPTWLTVTDEQGRRRLDDPADYVRIELQVALQRNIRLVPVLVHDVEMPREDELPDGLQRLAHKQALGLSTTRWKYDLGRLMEVLESVRTSTSPPSAALKPGQPEQPAQPKPADTESARAVPAAPPPHKARRGRRRALAGAGAIVAILVIVAIIGSGSGGGAKSHTGTSGGGAGALTATNASASSTTSESSASCSGRSPNVVSPAVTITFVNSAKVEASFYWLSYNGTRQLYGILAPGQRYSQATYEGNKWVIFKSGACSAMTVAKAGSQTFVIH